MAQSIKSNYIFNLLNSVSQLLFPLITFPYASRIMMADGIGQVQFFSSIISYISLFTCLGIPMYAIREVAKVRSDAAKMSTTTIEILLLHAMLTILGYVAAAIICMTVSDVQTDIPLFLILSATIFFTAIGCEWFYQGIEDFKYVAIRGLVVKIISVALLFLFVKTKEDILWYGAYTVFGVLGGNIFNFLRLRKYVDRRIVNIHDLHPLRHLKPAIHIFVFNVITSIYLQLNTMLLGFLKDVAAVGYFTAATKLMYMTMSVSNSLGSVMMPRASNLIAENKMNEFKNVVQKSYDFIIAISIPLTIGLIFTSKSAILLLSGNSFYPSILASQIVAINIISIGISGVMGMQILYPMGKINIVILCTFLGAITNVIVNVLLIPHYGHYGTAIAFATTELVVTVSMYFIGKKYIPIRLLKHQHLNYLVSGVAMGIVLFIIAKQEYNNIVTLLSMLLTGVSVYAICLIALHDPISKIIMNTIISKIRK
ncbi:flippase [Phocaeicola sp.]|uniref:flippase n=1 Tax=Phocaeicola sp. TaxID=2773926 RepID=UPI0030772ACA